MSSRLVVIGEIARPHGLRGEMRVTPLTDRPERFEGVTECVLWDQARDTRERCRITAARRQGAAVLVSVAGCETVEAASALVGRLVAVPEDEALPLPPGRFYPWQLEGCQVFFGRRARRGPREANRAVAGARSVGGRRRGARA